MVESIDVKKIEPHFPGTQPVIKRDGVKWIPFISDYVIKRFATTLQYLIDFTISIVV